MSVENTMSNEDYKRVLDQSIKPILDNAPSEELQDFLNGMKLMQEAFVCHFRVDCCLLCVTSLLLSVMLCLQDTLSKVPEHEQDLRVAIQRFLWEEDLVVETQSTFTRVLANEPTLKYKFSTFLNADIASKSDEDMARSRLCKLIGARTQRRNLNAPRPEQTQKFLKDVEVQTLASSLHLDVVANGLIILPAPF